MTVGYEELRDASYKGLGLDPMFTQQAEYPVSLGGSAGAYPEELADGVALSDNVVALFRVALRRNYAFHGAYYTVTSIVVGDTYRIQLDGGANNDYVALLGDTEEDIYTGLIAALQANGYDGEIISATDDDNYRSTACLYLWDPSKNTAVVYTESVPAGTGTADIESEATSVTFTIVSATEGEITFDELNGFTSTTVTTNWRERIEIAGDQRAFINVTATNGYCRCRIGPGELPS